MPTTQEAIVTHKINTDSKVAVSTDHYWQPMATCPTSVKVQLLGQGGVAQYGMYFNNNDFWVGWAPLPKIKKDNP